MPIKWNKSSNWNQGVPMFDLRVPSRVVGVVRDQPEVKGHPKNRNDKKLDITHSCGCKQ